MSAVKVLAGVVRISHMGGRQAGADNVHADRDQIADLERGARQHGAQLHLLPPELDVSGGLPLEQRPSLLKAIEGVERGDYDGIIVAYLSRLGRNVREQLRAWDRVEAAGGQIIVVQEGIDTSTPHGRLQRNILLSIAEHYREEHAERFENLRRGATAAGIWQRRQVPLGYQRDPQTRKLIPSDDADAVRAAFLAHAHGTGVTELSHRLGMTPTGVRRLLANRVYLGELRVGAHVNENAHEALIDEDLWLAAQTPMTVRRARSGGEVALLAGLVRCCGCGHIMSRRMTKVIVYACPRNHSAGPCPAPATITAKLLDEHVERIALVELDRLADAPAARESGVPEARAAVAAAERELAAYLQAISADDVGAQAFAAGARERRQRIDIAREQLMDVMRAAPEPIPAQVTDDWPVMSVSQRNRLLRGLIEAVLVARAGGRGRIVPIDSRVRVLRHGVGLTPGPYRGGGAALPVSPIELPDADDMHVLRA